MAKLTSDLAAQAVGGKYDMILIAARRARELNAGWNPLVKSSSGPVVTALEEIEAGKIGRDYLLKPPSISRNERPS